MCAFAANSLLCRIALQGQLIDPASFATLRVAAGAALLVWWLRRTGARLGAVRADWIGAASLAAYLLPFTLAYLTLPAGTGALILFGSAQLTMFAVGVYRGERFSVLCWAGLGLAVVGFIVLLAPGLAAPPAVGATLMGIAGVAWGVYSLRGQATDDPLGATAKNFLLVTPCALGINVLSVGATHVSMAGALFAIGSGTIASALGYVIWYSALRHLTALSAATVQLSVPVLAAFGGVLFLGESITPRLVGASLAILGGITVVSRQRLRPVVPAEV